MRKMVLVTALLSAVLVSGPLFAGGDAAAGKVKSASCTGCHGMNGKSNNPMYPNLAGQKKLYLEKAIKAYKSGARKDAMMAGFVSSLTDEDVADLSAYYSSVK